MPSRRERPRRWVAFAQALIALAALGSIGVPIPASAAAPAYTLEERAQAIAQPAVLFTELVTEGTVREAKTHKPLMGSTLTVTIHCSAVVVNPSGAALTSASCVAPTRARVAALAFGQYVNYLVSSKQLAAASHDSYLAQLIKTAEFVAPDGSEPTRQVLAQSGDATARLTGEPAIAIEPPEITDQDGYLTTVKLARSGLPAIEIDDAPAMVPGSGVVAVGYHAAVSGKTYEPNMATLRVPTPVENSRPTSYKFSSELPGETRGGAVVDMDGHMTGAMLWSNEANDVSAIQDALARGGVRNELSNADRVYRQALDDYFAGRYADAIRGFDSVTAANPVNTTAARYRALAASRQAIEGGESATHIFIPTWLIVSLSGLVGALIAVFLTIVLMRRRSAVTPSSYDTTTPISVNPFAPVSGPGYPTSGGAFAHYPTADYPIVASSQDQPISGPPVASPPNVLQIPTAAPPGVPVPRPPAKRLPEADLGSDAPDSQGEPAASQEAATTPAPVADTPQRPAPQFTWPEDESGTSSTANNNPWAAPSQG